MSAKSLINILQSLNGGQISIATSRMFTTLPSEDRGYVILNTDVEVADDMLSMIPYKDLEQESALEILVF